MDNTMDKEEDTHYVGNKFCIFMANIQEDG